MDKKISVNNLVFFAVRLETLRLAMHHGNWSDENEILSDSLRGLSEIKPKLEACDLSLTITSADRLAEKLRKGGINKKILHAETASVLQRLLDEAASKNFYYTTRSIGQNASHPFGEDFSARFPDNALDASEAQRCIWNRSGTAAVFHLMRIMERFVKMIGKQLKVQLDVDRANWADISNHIGKALKGLPSQTKTQRNKRDRIAASVAHLDAVRIAWRNPVMHPKANYSVEEAQQIFDVVKVFSRSMMPA